MRSLFTSLFFGLVALSLLVWIVQPRAEKPGKVTLVRLSDTNNLRQAQIDLFNRLHPNLDLQLDPTAGGVDTVIVQCMGGVGPDLFDCFDPHQLSAYVKADIAWDVTDEVRARGVDLSWDVFPGILKTATLDGRVYGVPTNIAADGIWFHKDLFEKLGISAHKGPWKWSEFIPIAEKLTIRDNRGHPVRYGFYFDWWNWAHFFKGFGARIYNESGTRCVVDSPQAIAAVQLMHDLVYKYKVSSSPVEEAAQATAGGFGSGSMSVFGSRHAATALGGRWWLAQLRTYSDLDLGVMESPYEAVHQFHAYGRATLINKESPRRLQALEYLLYMAGPDYNDLVNDQADGICAFRKYADTDRFRFNPNFPKEIDNDVWKMITENAAPDETSPFVNGQVVGRVMTEQLDLVKSDQKSAPDAMRDAAAQINAEMMKGLAADPALAERFRRAGGSM